MTMWGFLTPVTVHMAELTRLDPLAGRSVGELRALCDLAGHPDIQREWPDTTRPGLVHRVAPDQIWLDPDEIARAREQWDREHGRK